ncbi:PREDICTED: olfactory receptor 10AG1-like [Chinchilla lanigera]|uniref:olfactory receptor 10AG1-like n=1 Tax=Chinchilla lanigera TaxID=34839 RepID=UPI00038EB5A5|nr:PREDICTED: olfactory receptor 10AG1-like [Chinchilla lanigera]
MYEDFLKVFLEIYYMSDTLPKMFADLWILKGSISLIACATQMCFFFVLGGTKCLLLSVVGYDRYVAIRNPLHYLLIMRHKVCMKLVATSWLTGIAARVGQTFLIFPLPFFGSNQISQFCDIPPILKLSSGGTFINEMMVFTVAMGFITVPFLVTNTDKLLCLFYTILTPVLNPLICTLRNKDVTMASRKLFANIYAFAEDLKLLSGFLFNLAIV